MTITKIKLNASNTLFRGTAPTVKTDVLDPSTPSHVRGTDIVLPKLKGTPTVNATIYNISGAGNAMAIWAVEVIQTQPGSTIVRIFAQEVQGTPVNDTYMIDFQIIG
jgi:hypothetical protein